MTPDPARQTPYEAALDKGRKHARIHGFIWTFDTSESFAAGWALGVEEGRRQSRALDPEVAEVVADTIEPAY